MRTQTRGEFGWSGLSQVTMEDELVKVHHPDDEGHQRALAGIVLAGDSSISRFARVKTVRGLPRYGEGRRSEDAAARSHWRQFELTVLREGADQPIKIKGRAATSSPVKAVHSGPKRMSAISRRHSRFTEKTYDDLSNAIRKKKSQMKSARTKLQELLCS